MVWLHAPLEVLAQRLVDGRTRPLLSGDIEEKLARLLRERDETHRLVADAMVDADAPVEAVVQRCLGALGALS